MKKFLAFLVALTVLLSVMRQTEGVDRSKFRTCADTGFCRRHRGDSFKPSSYSLDVDSVTQTSEGHLAGKIKDGDAETALSLLVSVVGEGAIRVKISEDAMRYAPNTLLLPEAHKPKTFRIVKSGDASLPSALRGLPHAELIAISFDESILAIHPPTLKFDLYHKGTLQASANSRSMMHFELSGETERRELSKIEESEEDRHQGKEVVDYWEDGLAIYADGTKEERRLDQKTSIDSSSFEGDNFGGHKDSQPLGPKSVGIDFSFPYAQHVYGIPEHATSLSLPTTKGSAGKDLDTKSPSGCTIWMCSSMNWTTPWLYMVQSL